MATFISEQYPQLTLQDGDGIWAQFKDGVFETSDDAVAERLRALPEDQGIYEVKAAAQVEDPTVPKRSASKADWVKYAVGRGADRDAAEAMTRDQLADTYAAAQ